MSIYFRIFCKYREKWENNGREYFKHKDNATDLLYILDFYANGKTNGWKIFIESIQNLWTFNKWVLVLKLKIHLFKKKSSYFEQPLASLLADQFLRFWASNDRWRTV